MSSEVEEESPYDEMPPPASTTMDNVYIDWVRHAESVANYFNNKPTDAYKDEALKFKIKDVFDKSTYPKGKSNKVIAVVKKKI